MKQRNLFKMFAKKLLFGLALLIGDAAGFGQSPGVRNGHNMVYYTSSDGIILFGGADEAKVYGDTWLFSNSKWKKITENGPSPRTFPCMDEADNYILFFGGNAVLFGSDKNPVHYLDDTWIFRDGNWKKVETKLYPTARAEAAMGYDPLRKKIVLFGGRMAGEKWVAGDTWEFDGSKWTQMEKQGPTSRSGATLTYDPLLKHLVLFGGNPVIAKEKDYNGPMWSWDGNNWVQMSSAIPLVFNACVAYNTKEHFFLRFGGWNGSERLNETLTYKDKEWEKLALEIAPPARNHSRMVYDPKNNAFILFGGHDGDNVFGDMWSFKHGKWTLLYAVGPRRRVENGH